MQPISNTNHPCTNPEIAVNMQRKKHHIEITLDSGFNLYCFLFMFINHQHHQEFLKLFLQHIVLPTYCESLFTFDC
jgi:hypothetical protein